MDLIVDTINVATHKLSGGGLYGMDGIGNNQKLAPAIYLCDHIPLSGSCIFYKVYGQPPAALGGVSGHGRQGLYRALQTPGINTVQSWQNFQAYD